MNINMKKGFTLIELLAVIVILAIIALISVPMILNVVEKSREGSAKVSAENYLDAVEKYIAIEEIENKEIKIEKNKIYKLEEETNYEIEGEVDNTLYLNNVVKIKGDYPADGYIKIEEEITYAEFTINNYLIECNESGICEVIGKQNGKEVKAKSIEINEIDESELSIGKEIQLTAIILPKNTTDKTITWTSSNENVATISTSGLLKIIGYGEVTITAKTSNNKISEKIISINYKETILNGTYPEIKGELIPVTISSNGTVTYADIKEEWYNYENKTWANAVILKTGKSYNVGEIIPESDIKQYYVWIPRYRYELWNVNGESKFPNGTSESAINIVFESKNTAISNGTQNGEWLTHPAFTSFNTNGIWVGKYETSYDEETYTDSSKFLTTNPNYAAATNASNIIIKPNVRSLTNKTVSEFYTLERGVNESLNSHMMKNSEWGAVAYLTYSLYGKCTETGCEEVYLNNVNTGYLKNTAKFSGQWQYGATITGCSASTSSSGVSSNQSSCATGYAYNETNNKASTTGNISGIYDMSGGNWEYVMGVLGDSNGKPMSGNNSKYNSGFNGTYGNESGSKTNGIDFPIDTRYYDIYKANSTTIGDNSWYKYDNGHLGDGTKEIAVSKGNSSSGNNGLWYQDYAYFLTVAYPWFLRGGYFGHCSSAGVLHFSRNYGHAYSNLSSRVVLVY